MALREKLMHYTHDLDCDTTADVETGFSIQDARRRQSAHGCYVVRVGRRRYTRRDYLPPTTKT